MRRKLHQLFPHVCLSTPFWNDSKAYFWSILWAEPRHRRGLGWAAAQFASNCRKVQRLAISRTPTLTRARPLKPDKQTDRTPGVEHVLITQAKGSSHFALLPTAPCQ